MQTLTQKLVAKRYMKKESLYLCAMNRSSNINMYEGLASYFLLLLSGKTQDRIKYRSETQ